METQIIAIPRITPQNTQEPPTFVLSEPGAYFAGNRVHMLIDNSRGSREIELLIWYPALKLTDADGFDNVMVLRGSRLGGS